MVGPRIQGERDPKTLHNSGAQLASLSTEDLQKKLEQSFPGSSDWEGAITELNRRSGSRQERWIIATFIVSVIAAVAGIIALFR
jgi:hypothetical protein